MFSLFFQKKKKKVQETIPNMIPTQGSFSWSKLAQFKLSRDEFDEFGIFAQGSMKPVRLSRALASYSLSSKLKLG